MEKNNYNETTELLTEGEAMAILKCSRTQIYKLRVAGIIPHVRYSSKPLYRASDLHKFINQHIVNGGK